MNLTKLFETQKILRDRIGYSEPDRFDKLILALLVELGECANEWRGFKFWSKDQEPRKKKLKDGYIEGESAEYSNPLLEEYVDVLHFILELGLEIETNYEIELFGQYEFTITEQFNFIFDSVGVLRVWRKKSDYKDLFSLYIRLGQMLGFTWGEVEQAYFEKNKINHKRQEEGY